jgi:hypothetical protein
MTESKMIDAIFSHVRTNGVLVHRAQSDWGATRWSLDGIADVSVGDAGYTKTVLATEIKVRHTAGRNTVYMFGNESDLQKLYQEIVK